MILERLGADFALCRRVADPTDVPRPRDLLITTGRRAQALSEPAPAVAGAAAPIWLCVHGQDFQELRSRLRELGVHYLVNSAVDQESLRLLIEMLLHDRREQRVVARLPVGVEVTLRHGKQVEFAKLLDLSRTGARLRTKALFSVGDRLEFELPLELCGGGLECLSGRVARVELGGGRAAKMGCSVGVELDPLTAEAAAALGAILCGTHPATRISALANPRERERRRAERRAYRRRIAALAASDAGTPRVVLGHDLSVSGIRIARQPGLRKGIRIALGLYGADSGAPLTLEAEVVADHGPRGLGLAFRNASESQLRALAKLVAALPLLESLDGETGSGGGVVLSRVMPQKA